MDISHLKSETIEMFQDMFEQSKESLVVTTYGRHFQEMTSRLPSVEEVNSANPGYGNGKASVLLLALLVSLFFYLEQFPAIFWVLSHQKEIEEIHQ